MDTSKKPCFGYRTIFQNDLVDSRSHRNVKGQSQEGKGKGFEYEWEGLSATEDKLNAQCATFLALTLTGSQLPHVSMGSIETATHRYTNYLPPKIRICTFVTLFNHGNAEDLEAQKALKTHLTNPGQPGSRSESKKTDEATMSQFLANQKTRTRQMAKSLKKSQIPGFFVLQEIKKQIKANSKWFKILFFKR